MINKPITEELARKLIATQFPEYTHLSIKSVKKQGHDNHTFRLGDSLLIRMPTAETYALNVPKEQTLLPLIKPYLTIAIPEPVKRGEPSLDYPFPFSIYKWIEGESVNLTAIEDQHLEEFALHLARFLKELQAIQATDGLAPGQHNWWRGDHVSVYDKAAHEQIYTLHEIIDSHRATKLWDKACQTKWNAKPVWVHGDVAVGNLIVKDKKLTAVIDFGGMATGDPACDLVIAWTFLYGKSRKKFMEEMALDDGTWLRAKAWALWKATYELCQIQDKNSNAALIQKKIINEVLT